MRLGPDRLFEIFDSLDYHVAVYDRSWRYTYVNAEAARVLGRVADDLLGRSIWELFPEAVGNQYYREVHDAAATGRIIHSDHYYAPFDKWFENHIYPLTDGVLVLSRDVSRERRAAAALQEREQMLRLAQRAGRVATFEWDADGQTARCSSEFFAMVGLPEPDGALSAVDWSRFVHAEDHARMTAHLAAAVECGALEPLDVRVITAGGDTRWVTFAGQLQQTSQGHRLLGTILDITDRTRSALALEAAKNAAESANRVKDHFLATLSHELRTPLHAIVGYAHMLQTNVLPPEQWPRAIEVIHRNALAQAQLVDELLDMSRITSGTVRLNPAPIQLGTVLRDAVQVVKPAADARRIQVDVEIDPAVGIVNADGGRLRQVLWNLLSNAVKFSDEGGRIVASARRGPHDVQIAIADTGRGIAPEFLAHVFEPFRQGETDGARVQGGLGLGLTISKQLVELHGGTIRVASGGRGHGATFTVCLPHPVTERPEDQRTQVTDASAG